MSDAIDLLRKELTNNEGGALSLLTDDSNTSSSTTTTDIKQATHLHLQATDTVLSLSTLTKFTVNDKQISLKVIVYSWLNKELSTTEFIESAERDDIEVLTFAQRNSLCLWLSGENDTCEYISDSTTTTAATTTTVTATATATTTTAASAPVAASAASELSASSMSASIAPVVESNPESEAFLKSVLLQERELFDHNATLRGTKPINFANTAKECEIRILKPLKRKAAGSASKSSAVEPDSKKQKKSSTNAGGGGGGAGASATLTPVILISPAASALLNLQNISAFFEHSKFIDPTLSQSQRTPSDLQLLSETSTDSNIKNITHQFPRAGKIRLHITNSVDFFTKPSYWDRVVAVITTGQEWQFKNYKWSKPRELFQNIKGYYFHFDNDKVPEIVKAWNVEKIGIDKNRRFKDAESLNVFWDSLERVLLSKGYRA